MQFASEQVTPKFKHEVKIRLHDGTEVQTNLFLSSPQQRLVDMLNDSRIFVPAEDNDGGVVMLNKSFIALVIPTDQSIERAQDAPAHIGVA